MAEAVRGENWGRSLPSENVQALAQEMSDTCMEIPQRYIRPELDVGVTAPICDDDDDDDDDDDEGGSDDKVPIIDMNRLLDPNFSLEESAKLHSACMDWGFFQLVNHGVSDEVIEKIKVDLEEFYKLPLKEKEVFAPLPGSLQGYGHKLVRNEEKLEWQDRMFLITQPLHARNFTFWPTSPPTFSDASGLTLLLQVRDVQGLQFKRKGKWLPVQPLENALEVNIGDALEVNLISTLDLKAVYGFVFAKRAFSHPHALYEPL
ncbi:hypothetical protein J5N97_029776 [Dioscorea zingiberensis]|uniref:Non-haem dioxygenase N-terminal domain-containing protein n=1 Tax=Dioscorea zingiberensis TaxID=325984 RepID=A0A9D5BWD0_9LILI|nr:hypothetical protein J5N97_029776 [Dioscorea zingiberensis]